MGAYDIFMLLIIVFAVLFGALKGLAWQIASLSAIFVSYIVALNFHEMLAGHIDADAPWNKYIAMFVLYMGTSLVIWILFAVVRRVIEQIELKDFDRHAGAVVGAINGAILCLLITLFAVTLPVLGDDQKTSICQSQSGYLIAKAINHLEVGLPKDVNQVVSPYLDGLKTRLDEHHSTEDFEADLASEDDTQEVDSGAGESAENRQPNITGTAEERTARSLLEEIDKHFGNEPR